MGQVCVQLSVITYWHRELKENQCVNTYWRRTLCSTWDRYVCNCVSSHTDTGSWHWTLYSTLNPSAAHWTLYSTLNPSAAHWTLCSTLNPSAAHWTLYSTLNPSAAHWTLCSTVNPLYIAHWTHGSTLNPLQHMGQVCVLLSYHTPSDIETWCLTSLMYMQTTSGLYNGYQYPDEYKPTPPPTTTYELVLFSIMN